MQQRMREENDAGDGSQTLGAHMDDQRPIGERGLRFSTRDLFWLVVVAALIFGWWL
jgi:hypothetical protein